MTTSILIGICTSNDGKTIGRLLDQCLKLKMNYDNSKHDIRLEQLIVVSSGSSDKTNDILDKFEHEHSDFKGFRSIIETNRKGKTDAINKILELNTSDFIIFIPADVVINYSSINFLVEKIKLSDQIGVVSGKPIPNLAPIKTTIIRGVIEAIWNLHDETLKYTTKRKFNSHSSGELMIVRSKLIQKLPSHIINDDAYIALTIKSKGYEIEYESRAKVKIDVPRTMNDYIIQRKRVLIGHTQNFHDLNKTSSNFKSILKNDPKSTIGIIKNIVKSSKNRKGLLFAIILELRIEFEIFLIKFTKKPMVKRAPIWKRINQDPKVALSANN